MEVNGTDVSIVKFDTELNKSIVDGSTNISFNSERYLNLYTSRDRFSSLIFIFIECCRYY